MSLFSPRFFLRRLPSNSTFPKAQNHTNIEWMSGAVPWVGSHDSCNPCRCFSRAYETYPNPAIWIILRSSPAALSWFLPLDLQFFPHTSLLRGIPKIQRSQSLYLAQQGTNKRRSFVMFAFVSDLENCDRSYNVERGSSEQHV